MISLYMRRKAKGLCGFCSRPPVKGKSHCVKCQARRARVQKRRVQCKVVAGLCRCGKPKPCEMCRANSHRNSATSRAKLKAESIRRYGGKCTCCNEDELEFLTIDHTEGGGSAHRKTDRLANRIHYWLKKHNYPKGFRVLCANCNQATIGGKTCPHKRRKRERTSSGTSPTEWRVVLGFGPFEQPTRAEINARWWERIRKAHPDVGGSNDDAVRVNRARDEALRQARR